jgi:hypothetical protein
MQKAAAFFLLLLICLPILLAAQEENPPNNPDWDYYYDDAYSMGDQTFIISLGTVFPTFFFDSNGTTIDHKFTPPVGGAGSLAYNYYLTTKFFAGIEVEGMFFSTLGSNMLFTIPVSIRGGYQFNFLRFEFPVNVGFGMVWHRYLNQTYFGIFAKAGGGAFFRATTNWSFGIVSNWYWFPQWTKNKSESIYGNIISATLAARYHF